MTDTVAVPADVLLIDRVPGLVAILNGAGEILALNGQVLEYYGQQVNVLMQWSSNGIIHADDVPRVASIFADALASGTPYDYDARVRRHDGVYRWFRVRGEPFRDAAGNLTRWYVLLTDIDDRKRAEAMLAGEKQLFEMVASGKPISVILEGICRLVESTAGNCRCSVVLVDATGSWLEHGAAPSLPESYTAAVIGRSVSAAEGPCATAAAFNQQVIVRDLTTDTRWTHAGWRPVALEHGLRSCWSTPIPSPRDKVLGTFAIYHDEPATPTAAEQRLIEQLTNIASIAIERTLEAEALKRSESLLAQVEQISGTGGFYLWPATGKAYWSDQVYRIHEMEPGAPVTPEVRQKCIHPDDLPALLKALEPVLKEGRDFEYEVRLLMPGGRIKHVHLMMRATRDAANNLLYVGAVQDVTAPRLSALAMGKLRSELSRVARITTLGALAASIAHEVNQPLSGIIANASTCLRMLGANPPNVAGAGETARRTLRDGNRAAEVITKLRALYSGQEPTSEPFDLNEAAREVIAVSLGELQRNRVVVRTELADHLPRITGDRVQIQQVILNFVRNASEAMQSVEDRPRDLLITTELNEGNRVRLNMRDAGIGLAPDAAAKLFDAFYTTKRDGMGMGLSVSRSIIERHRGRIWATSNRNHGVTFSFSIPADT